MIKKNLRDLVKGLPTRINILGTDYKITYVDKPSDASTNGRESLFGQIDPWTATIRVLVGSDRPRATLWRTIFHEIVHGIIQEYQITEVLDCCESAQERVAESMAGALYDTLTRNRLVTFP